MTKKALNKVGELLAEIPEDFSDLSEAQLEEICDACEHIAVVLEQLATSTAHIDGLLSCITPEMQAESPRMAEIAAELESMKSTKH